MKVDTSLWSESTQSDFIEGWEDAGEYMGDLDSPSPWCCHWSSNSVIDVNDKNRMTWAKNIGKSLRQKSKR